MKRFAPLLLLLASTGLASADVRYELFPVGGVFFSDDAESSLIDADFRSVLSREELHYFEERFRKRFRLRAADTISEANYRRTYAVSLQIARASRYTVEKIDGTVDLYAPVTASIYFTNLATGEVLYANTRTTIKTVSAMPDPSEIGKRIASLFIDSYRDVVDDLVGDAAKRFHPEMITATVRTSWNKLAVLDAGKDKGLAPGDALEGDGGKVLRVISSGASHAVARAEEGTFATGSKFTKIINGTLDDVRKPRLLPLVVRHPKDFPDDALVQVFSDELSSEARISLIPVNRTFGAVLRAVKAQIKLSRELSQREWPTYFVRFSVLEPLSYERPTNLAYKTLRVTLALAYAEVIDHAGRVLYAARGTDRLEDEITSGMALDLRARKEIAVKNALHALAKRFAAEFKLETASLPVVQGGQKLSVRDEHGFIVAGDSAKTFRNIGKFGGIETDVLVPTWEVKAVGREGDLAQLTTGDYLAAGVPLPEPGDVLLLEGVRDGAAQRKRFGPCGLVEKLGTVDLPEFGDLAMNLFAAAHPAPFYMVGTTAQAMELIRVGSGFKEDLKLREPEFEYCVQPGYRIDTDEPSCSNGACVQVARIKFTFRVRQGGPEGAVKVGKVIETRMTSSALPREAFEAVRREALHMDLLEEALKLAPSLAGAIAQQKL